MTLGGIIMTVYFYQRISTKETSDKQSFQRQEKSLKAYAQANDIKYNERNVYKDDVSGSTFNRKEWLELEERLNDGDTIIFKEISRFTRQAEEGYKKYMEFDVSGSTFNRKEWLELEERLNDGDTIIFKEISRFTRQAEEGYKKYMELLERDINLVFIDNPTVSSDYIKQLMSVANAQQLVAKTALESTIKLLLIVELDRVQQEREIIVKRIKQGIQASDKKQGRKVGQLDKMSDELRSDIKLFISDRSIKQVDLVKRIKQGIQASDKKQGRKVGQLDKMSDELRSDIKLFISDRSIKQVDLMNKHNISRNTLKKYVEIVKKEG